jgi:predicted MPP superfamily phosphohydrolase
VLKGLVASGVGAATGTSAYGFLYSRHQLQVTRETIIVAGLPSALGGLRVGLLTDVHRSRWVSHEDVHAAVSMLMTERPDLIVLGGDYVTWGDRQFVVPAAEALAPLAAPVGVFAVLGNHDDDHEMPAALDRPARYLKYVVTKLNKRYTWVLAIAMTVCGAAICTLAGIIIYLAR